MMMMTNFLENDGNPEIVNMFLPNQRLEEIAYRIMRSLYEQKIVCMHIRSPRSNTQLVGVVEYIQNVSYQNKLIKVAGDWVGLDHIAEVEFI